MRRWTGWRALPDDSGLRWRRHCGTEETDPKRAASPQRQTQREGGYRPRDASRGAIALELCPSLVFTTLLEQFVAGVTALFARERFRVVAGIERKRELRDRLAASFAPLAVADLVGDTPGFAAGVRHDGDPTPAVVDRRILEREFERVFGCGVASAVGCEPWVVVGVDEQKAVSIVGALEVVDADVVAARQLECVDNGVADCDAGSGKAPAEGVLGERIGSVGTGDERDAVVVGEGVGRVGRPVAVAEGSCRDRHRSVNADGVGPEVAAPSGDDVFRRPLVVAVAVHQRSPFVGSRMIASSLATRNSSWSVAGPLGLSAENCVNGRVGGVRSLVRALAV